MLRRLKGLLTASTAYAHTREHLRAVWQRRKHPEGIIPRAPVRIIIEPTNKCNLACGYCGNKDMVRPATFLDLGMYERLLDEMVELGIPRCTLHTIGEPTLHPRIAEMIAMAKARNRIVTMSTNGTMLTETMARNLVLAGPDMLHVSADAADDDVLAKQRDGVKAKTLIDGMRRLRHYRDTEGPVRDSPWGRVRLPTLVVTGVVTPLFTRDVERRFFEAFAPLVDDVVFHNANNHAGYVPDEGNYRREKTPHRLRKWFFKKVRRPCNYPWDTMFLLSDGTMSVCRFDFDARVKVGRYPEQNLMELWHSQKMASLRRAHMNFDFREWSTCDDCSGMMYENRHEHWEITRKMKRRNGMVAARDVWQPQNPMGVEPGSIQTAAEPQKFHHLA